MIKCSTKYECVIHCDNKGCYESELAFVVGKRKYFCDYCDRAEYEPDTDIALRMYQEVGWVVVSKNKRTDHYCKKCAKAKGL